MHIPLCCIRIVDGQFAVSLSDADMPMIQGLIYITVVYAKKCVLQMCVAAPLSSISQINVRKFMETLTHLHKQGKLATQIMKLRIKARF